MKMCFVLMEKRDAASEIHPEFLYLIQSAVLLALQERGYLTQKQYHDAIEMLRNEMNSGGFQYE